MEEREYVVTVKVYVDAISREQAIERVREELTLDSDTDIFAEPN